MRPADARVGLQPWPWWIHPAISRYAHIYAHTRVHSGISAAQKPARTAEIRRGGIPRGSITGNGPGFPAHAQAARELKIGVDYVLTRARDVVSAFLIWWTYWRSAVVKRSRQICRHVLDTCAVSDTRIRSVERQNRTAEHQN